MTSRQLVASRRRGCPVGLGADVATVAEATGAYVNDEPHHLQSTGFVLAPDGTVLTAVYSSGAIGRLLPDDVAGLVRLHPRTQLTGPSPLRPALR